MKINHTEFTGFVLAGLISLCIGFGAQAQNAEPVGLMLSTIGEVTAEDLEGNVRRLQRRSPVFEGDTLITANRARAQVRFNDRGLVALQPNTSFFIEEHKFSGQEDGTESAIYSLLRGGLQAITGLIGHSNKDRYKVSTPIATIGLRGTHWAATFCTTTCDGNPPGLYGGVADGGIDVCNGGGCTAVETNSYFYTPDANTQATRLLAPPSVVFAAVEEGNEDADEEDTAVASETEEGDSEVVSSVEAFVERSVSSLGPVSVNPTDNPGQANQETLETDPVQESNEDLVQEIIDEEITSAASTTDAPAGSVVVLATSRGVNTGNAQTAALNILIQPSGTSVVPRAAFVEVATEAATTTALGALDFDLAVAGCDPCLYATAGLEGTVATLAQSIETRVDGVDVFMGRWTGDALLLNSGVDLNALQDHHYAIALEDGGIAFSPDLPGVDVLENSVGVFTLLEATSPTDSNGVVGSLDRVELVLDLYQQMVTEMELDISFADEREIFASLDSSFGFSSGSVAGLFAPLSGFCQGGSCGDQTLLSGDTSLSFIGDSAEHILGAYSLDTQSFDQSYFGVYLLGLDHLEDGISSEPDYVKQPEVTSVDGIVSIATLGERLGEFAPMGTTTNSEDTEIGVTSQNGHTNLVVRIDDTEMDEEGGSFILEEAMLEEYITLNGSGFDATLGRWKLYDSLLFLDDAYRDHSSDGHFAYSSTPTDFDLLIEDAYPDLVAPLLHYSLSEATSVTDHEGNIGTLSSLDFEVNVLAQIVTEFSMSIDIANAQFIANLFGSGLLYGNDDIHLAGVCTGGYCGVSQPVFGSVGLGFLGDEAQAVLGYYGLASYTGDEVPLFEDDTDFDQAYFSDIAVTGVFLAEQDMVSEAASGQWPSSDLPTTVKYLSVTGSGVNQDGFESDFLEASMELDLFTQTLTRLSLDVQIDDTSYYAEYNSKDSLYYSGDISPLGINLDELFTESIPMIGQCAGGGCETGDYYSYYYEGLGLGLYGTAELSPFGESSEGLLGIFELSDCLPFSDCSASTAGIQLEGDFVLAQYETLDHLGWQQNPVGVAAVAPSVAAVAGTLQNLVSSPVAYTPFAGVFDPADSLQGGSFTTISIEDHNYVVDSFEAFAGDCEICSFEVENAVAIEVGEVFLGYQYSTDVNQITWSNWANNDSSSGWIGGVAGNALDTNPLLSVIYADNLTQTDLTSLNPLTGYSSTSSYYYAGGPSPFDERSSDLDSLLPGYVSGMSLTLDFDFEAQRLQDFYADIEFGSYGDTDYRNFYLAQDYASSVSLAQVMQISDLTGFCSGCESGGGSLTLSGEASFALVGDNAEQIIGSLAAWSEENSSLGVLEGDYALQAAFILNQDFYTNWVEASGESFDLASVAAVAPIFSDGLSLLSAQTILALDDGTVSSGEIQLTEHFSSHDYYNGEEYSYYDVEDETVSVFTNYSDVISFGLSDGFLYELGQTIVRDTPYGFDPSEDFDERLFTANWGIWESETYFHTLGLAGYDTYFTPFVNSTDVTLTTSPSWIDGGPGNYVQYKYSGGPGLTGYDGLSNVVGGYVDNILMNFDFATSSVIDFDMQLTDWDSIDYDVSLVSATPLSLNLTDFQVELSGLCSGCESSVTGQTSFNFLGDNAEGALGNFYLQADSLISGVYTLAQNDHWVDVPEISPAADGGVVGFASSDINAESVVVGFEIDGTNTAQMTNVEAYNHNHPNSLAAFTTGASEADCVSCSWFVQEAELSNYDNSNSPYLDYLPDAYWGRWETQEAVLTEDGTPVDLKYFQHWVYAPNPTDLSDTVLWDASNGTQSYSYVDGTVVTDLNGNESYSGIEDFSMSVNFGTQMIETFEFDVSVANWDFAPEMVSPTPLSEANISLSGSVWDGEVTYGLNGNSSIYMIGDAAEAAVGAFGLEALAPVSGDIVNTVNGAFLLENDNINGL